MMFPAGRGHPLFLSTIKPGVDFINRFFSKRNRWPTDLWGLAIIRPDLKSFSSVAGEKNAKTKGKWIHGMEGFYGGGGGPANITRIFLNGFATCPNDDVPLIWGWVLSACVQELGSEMCFSFLSRKNVGENPTPPPNFVWSLKNISGWILKS